MVAAQYRFISYDNAFTLGETTAVKTGSNAFSLSGVYTQGGGSFTYTSNGGGNGTWAYLYDATGKKGIVIHYTSGSFQNDIKAYFGQSEVETQIYGDTFIPAVTTTDISSSPSGGFQR